MQGAQNHIVGDQMMFGIFVRASAFFFVLRVSSWVRQEFLPTGELGIFSRLAVFLGIETTGAGVEQARRKQVFHHFSLQNEKPVKSI